MSRIGMTLIFLLLCAARPVAAQEELRLAVSAAMGEMMADARYQQVLGKYGLPMPDIAGNTMLASPARNHYPERVAGSLLDHVVGSGRLRIGWIRVGIPFSFVGKDGKLQGLAIDLWPLLLEKLSAKYGKKVEPVFVEFTVSTGNNDMYLQLSSDRDPNCASMKLPSPDMCYDVIGGAYAFNEPRKKVSALTTAYYPMNMAGVRTPVPLKDKAGRDIAFDTPEQILAAAKNPEAGVIFAVLAATGEVQFLNGLKQHFGDTFKVVTRSPTSNLLEFAQNTEAHIVLSTNVRALYTRAETPQFCKGCAVIPGLQLFDGVGFATALTKK